MSSLWFIGGALGLGVALLTSARLRTSARRRLDEALPECPIAELDAGRYRVVGRVVPILTSPSAVDGAECVYLERAEYRTVGTGVVPLLREVEHRAITHAFFLQDATGRVRVDPATTLVDCAQLSEDGGLVVERRLRAGEEVALDARFRYAEGEASEVEGPYRTDARSWAPVEDPRDPPRLSHRTDRAMMAPPVDDLSAFLGGAGALMLLMGALLACVIGLAGG